MSYSFILYFSEQQFFSAVESFCLVFLEVICRLDRLWQSYICCQPPIGDLQSNCSPCRLLRHSKNGCGSFTNWGLSQRHVHGKKRNSQPGKNLDSISVTWKQPILLICSVRQKLDFRCRDCLFSTSPRSSLAIFWQRRGGHCWGLLHVAHSFRNSL